MFNNIISTYTIEALIVHIICTLGSGTTLDDDDNKINNTVIIVTLYKKGKKKTEATGAIKNPIVTGTLV